eukprot:CAMPEP_0180335460 /NCGR_PEP_ID=MMETSP0988-20121125/44260_1 /TAXON_ID=697907 /ORGANISM="non described non described, Strain CCMP2293" /LENGTH=30 /DNA_ID= /DNA_START= /DNA_END= /DNA_ORIENTATION=
MNLTLEAEPRSGISAQPARPIASSISTDTS